MAVSNKGTKVSIAASLLPAAYTKPTVVEVEDYEYTQLNEVVTIAKADVENATAATTMANIVTAITAAVTAQMGADYDDAANTIDVYADLKAMTNNFNVAGVLFTTGAVNYLCTVDIYIKTTLL